MKKQSLYKIEDINIGDEVIFESTNSQSNHDLYWKVTAKEGNRIKIKLTEMGFDDYWAIQIDDVIAHIPISRLKE